MSRGEQTFHSKILLFGEYSIIQDSMGLTVPYEIFKGSLIFEPREGVDAAFIRQSNAHLAGFLAYIIQKLEEDVKNNPEIKGIKIRTQINNGNAIESIAPRIPCPKELSDYLSQRLANI